MKTSGRVVLACVILSLVVGLTSQALETKSTVDKLNNEATEKKAAAAKAEEQRQKDETERAVQMNQLQNILGTAHDASTQSKAAATQSATAIQGLSTITAAQSIGLEKSWRQERLFGQWKAQLTVQGVQLDDPDWIAKILAYSHRPNVTPINNMLVIRPTMDVYPSQDDRHDYMFGLSTSSRVSFTDPSDPVRDPFGDNPNFLGFELEPTPPPFIVAHINDDKTSVTSFDLRLMNFNCTQRSGTPAIRNWIDLYGREMTLTLNAELADAERISFHMYYENTNDSQGLSYSCGPCRHVTTGTASIRLILTEKELGDFPSDYKILFPSEYKKIEQRMRNAKLGAGPSIN